MKHKIISCISIPLLLLIAFSTITISASATDTNLIASSKISPDLQQLLLEMDSTDTINVAIWLNNTNKTSLESAYKNELQKAISRGIITTDVTTATALFDESSTLEATPVSIEKAQQLLSIRRSSYSSVITNQNIKSQTIINNSLGKEIKSLYTSKYAPLLLAETTKLEISALSLLNEVEHIYPYIAEPTSTEFDLHSDSISTNSTSVSQNYGVWQENTGINELHNKGYLGSGIKIGLYDQGSPNILHESNVFSNSNTEQAYYDTTHSHATYMASILVGKTSDYTGVAPNATLVYAGYKDNYFSDIDKLIDRDINVLSISFFVLNNVYNSYGVYSKFIDYISNTHNILVCIAASNYSTTPQGIPEVAMAYNAITVGNIDDKKTSTKNDDILSDDSCYVEYSSSAYKPDICAPGARASTASSPNVNGYGGTSAATPIVAGICALLMEADSRLIGKTALVKSIVMSSAERIPNMEEVYSSSSSITPALSRGYGAGMINAKNALSLVESTSQWRSIELQSALASETPYTMNFTVSQSDINSSKNIAICLSWLKKVSTDSDGLSIVYDVTDYNLSVKLGNTVVAKSSYRYDNKQFVYFKPTTPGTYKVVVEKNNITNNKTPIAFSYYKTN